MSETSAARRAPLTLLGEQVGLCATSEDEYVARWDERGGDALGAMLGMNRPPPRTRESWGDDYRATIAGGISFFEARLLAGGECAGEVSLTGIMWPHASADVRVSIFVDGERGRDIFGEVMRLVLGYAFEVLGLNRLEMWFLKDNRMVADTIPSLPGRIVAEFREAAWAFGRRSDVAVWDCLEEDWKSSAVRSAT